MKELEPDDNEGGSKIKKSIILFVVFLIVISSAFIENMNVFSTATVDGGKVTVFGYIVQALALVIIYTLMSYLVDMNII